MARTVRCKGCGRFRPLQLAHVSGRSPCPHCGGTAVTIGAASSIQLSLIGRVSTAHHPSDQRQNWERRWQDIQDEAAELLTPLSGTRSSDAIQAARRRLGSFYVNAYHLKDDLIYASAAIGITKTAIENAINNDSDLALLCDLANLTKHRHLSKPPRSGYTPRIQSWSGTGSPTESGWRLTLTIDHNGHQLDGLDVARRAINAWQRTLRNWNLI